MTQNWRRGRAGWGVLSMILMLPAWVVWGATNTLWPSSTVPGLVDGGADSPVEVGVKFRADVAGKITALRFYKASANTGQHVGNLWSSNGTLLASVTFSNETASGWQQAGLTSPVSISSNTLYVASYHVNNGHYSADINYFASQGQDSVPLHAPATGTVGGNGVYAYGSGSVFPNQTWSAANYWVDVVFETGPPPTLTNLVLAPLNASILTGNTQPFSATGRYSDGSTQNLTTQVTWASSAAGVASISSGGLATGLDAGSTVISATLGSVSTNTTLTVQMAPLAVTTTSLVNGALNAPYSVSLGASGGKLPYTWSLLKGPLPSGLTLSSGGTIAGLPTLVGTSNFTVRVSDAGSPANVATQNLSLTIVQALASLWPTSTVPGLVDGGPDIPVELGLKFRSDVAGTATGVRFYKGSANTGQHVGNLWSSNGTLLASVTFSNETASGWQQAKFASPVSLTPNALYVVSYHANNGHYSADINYFSSQGWDNAPLHAPANGAVAGGNGVYGYGSGSVFPNQTWSAANYWVDVLFQPGPPPTLNSLAVTPANPSLMTGSTLPFSATGTYTDGSTQNLTTQVTWGSSAGGVATISSGGVATGLAAGTTTISATLSNVSGSTLLTVQTAPLTITTSALAAGTLNVPYNATLAASGGSLPYTWSLLNGGLPTGLNLTPSGAIVGTPTVLGTSNFTVRVSDASVPTGVATQILSLTIGPAISSLWSSATVPGGVDGGPDGSVELGVKFRSDTAGTVTGLRFYKASANTGTHVGSLWSSNGTLLASITFSNETASGWQQANFTNPVALSANTLYVASYHANNGHYSADMNYFASQGWDNAPLHAPATGAVGGNGVFRYGSSSVFPNQTWSAANYWVDVLFQAAAPPTLNSIAVTPANPAILTGNSQQFTATGTYSDGSTKNLSTQVTWTSSATGVATINTNGLASGLSAGTTLVTATLGSVSGNTGLTVQSAPLTITTTLLTEGWTNFPYNATLTANGGTLPYTWSLAVEGGALPPGITLSPNGVLSGMPVYLGTNNFTVQVTDAGNPPAVAVRALSLAVVPDIKTIWPNSAVPTLVDAGADVPVELGVKFRSDVSGTVTGIRYYKSSANTGAHVGNLWSSNGTLLATANFGSETASGWQHASFPIPVVISSNTVYVASYHVNNGHYSADLNYFSSTGMDSPPLHALASGVAGTNGVFAYGTGSLFPNQGYRAANYWVDVVFAAGVLTTLNQISVAPANPSIFTGAWQQYTATGTYSDGSMLDLTAQVAWSSSASGVALVTGSGLAIGMGPGNATITARLGGVSGTAALTVQTAPLAVTTTGLAGGMLGVPYSTTLTATGGLGAYTWSLTGGSLPAGLTLNTNTGTIAGLPSALGTSTFSVQVKDAGSPARTASASLTLTMTAAVAAPLLVLTNGANPFSGYYAEILLAEGLNVFELQDVSALSATLLNQHDMVLLGEGALSAAQVTLLSDWVNAGGKLIAMRPDKQLAGLLGLVDTGTSLAEAYLLVNTTTGPGVGIVNQTIQFHGTADCYALSGASSLATLYTNAVTATTNPAVTLRPVGANGGQAAAFTYDLAKSVVLTRQGNPAWAGQERDGASPIRSDDLFFGPATGDPQANWVDFNKIAIPQADEQQRLLANLLVSLEASRNLLPRFWYFPNGHRAVVIMTGDDHANAGTVGRFNQYAALSPAGGTVEDWTAVRSTSYVFPNTPMTDAQAAAYNAAGFELGIHLNTGCSNWTPTTFENFFATQLPQFRAAYPSLPAQTTHRIHCIAWSDYTSAATISLAHGIRLDTSYYYWPSNWVNSRPGLFTGSGMPMRFATAQGQTIDVYQAATQMTDESGQSYPPTADTLLDRALGAEGYYGAFVANMHTDLVNSPDSDGILSSALSRGVPIIAARQLLTWLDARNSSTLRSVVWSTNRQSFTVDAHPKARGLQVMVPVPGGYTASAVTRNGSPVSFSTSLVKGIVYVVVPALSGDYAVTFTAQ